MKGVVYENGDFRITITTDMELGQVRVEVVGIPVGQSEEVTLQGWFEADEAQDMAQGLWGVAVQTEEAAK